MFGDRLRLPRTGTAIGFRASRELFSDYLFYHWCTLCASFQPHLDP